MKEQDFPKLNQSHYPLHKHFFIQQGEEISKKSVLYEKLKIQVSENPEILFPHPKGIWLTMEGAIQNRIHGSAPQVQHQRSPVLAWVAAQWR